MAKSKTSSLRAALRECRSGFVFVGVFSLFINVLILTSPIYMMQTFDRVLSSGRVETLVYLTLIAGIAVLVMGLLEMIRSRLLHRMSRWLGRRLAPELISTSMAGTRFGIHSGAQPLRDLQTIRGFMSSPAVNTVFDSPWVPIFLAVIYLMHEMLGMIAIGAAVVLFAIALLNEVLSRQALKQAGQMGIANMQRADSAMRNAEVFHAMGMLPGFLRSWADRDTAVLDLQVRAGDLNANLLGFSKFVRMFVQILILGAGAYLVLQAELSSGGMIAASILLGRALAPIEQAIGAWKSMVSVRDAYGRLKTLVEKIPSSGEPMPLPAPVGRVDCEQVIFVPPGREQPVLNGIHFTIDPGEALGIIGPSASGKTTLCKVLVGTWRPTRGRARLDGADIFNWPAEQLGPFVGYLPQDVELFSGSVRDNIARLDPDPDPQMVVEAAAAAGVHDMILHLPHGYETPIGEGGAYLSGGQRQRLGLARALFGKPKLIVLDEPSANLDSEGEDALNNALRQAKGWGATVVLVAHHVRILRPVDKLLVLREGRMELFGPRDEVLTRLRPQAVTDQRPRPPQPPTAGATAQPSGGGSPS